MAKEYKMMDELVCYCKKCGMDLNHRVTRVENGAPKKVLCLTCKADHMFRKNPTETARASSGSTVIRKPRASSAKAEQETEWRTILTRGERTPKPYSMETAFEMDDHMQHPVFGRGLVVALVPPDKVNVFFEDGVKTMKCGNRG